MKTKVAETDIAAVVVRHFLDCGAEVYQEVAPFGNSGPRADLVAVLGPVVHVVEVKASFSLDVIEQAWYWRERGYAHRVSVAVPSYRRSGMRAQVCRHLGIGVLGVEVASDRWETSRVRELYVAPLSRRLADDKVRRSLNERQKTYAAAGNNAGKFWSPFKATCEALREVVESEPGLTWREALKRVKHHYASDSSAASTLHRFATGSYGIDELRWLHVTKDRPARLYVAGTEPLIVAADRQMELTA